MAVATVLTPKKTAKDFTWLKTAQAVGGIRGGHHGVKFDTPQKNDENSCPLENVTGFHCLEKILVKTFEDENCIQLPTSHFGGVGLS